MRSSIVSLVRLLFSSIVYVIWSMHLVGFLDFYFRVHYICCTLHLLSLKSQKRYFVQKEKKLQGHLQLYHEIPHMSQSIATTLQRQTQEVPRAHSILFWIGAQIVSSIWFSKPPKCHLHTDWDCVLVRADIYIHTQMVICSGNKIWMSASYLFSQVPKWLGHSHGIPGVLSPFIQKRFETVCPWLPSTPL